MRISQLSTLKHAFSFAKGKSDAQLRNIKIRSLFKKVSEVVGQEGRQLAMRIEQDLYKQQRDILEQNQKVNNYHRWEYFRGEDYIQKVPYSPNHTYTAQDKANEQKDRERVAIQELQPISNHLQRARLIKEKISAYHDKQKKYEIQEFQKYLSEYPGSPKGPRPEDDWQAYRAYGLKKIPKILMDELKQAQQSRQGFRNSGKRNQQEDMQHFKSPEILLSYLSADRPLMEQQEEGKQKKVTNTQQNNVFELSREWDQQYLEEIKFDVPRMPNMTFENYQHMMNHLVSWTHFRNYYVQKNQKENMKKMQKKMQRLAKSLNDSQSNDPENQWFDLKPSVPSLCRYYRCLPKWIQDHPGIKDIYLGLEYTAPDFTYEEKEDALNWACKWVLPFDDISKKVLTDYTARSREYVTPYMREKLFTVSPEYTWDMDAFLEELKRQQIKGQTTTENKDAKPIMPPQVHLMWQEGAPNLPVDYYDNSDGFWDQIISQKLKRYDEAKPMIKTRRHFKH